MNGKHQKIRKPSNNKALRKLKNRFKQTEEKQHEQNHQLRSALDQEEKNLSLVKESFKQITNLQQQKHASIRSDLDDEEERLRSSSAVIQNVTRPVRQLFSCFPNWNGTGNQNPSFQYVDEVQQEPHSEKRSSIEEKETYPFLQRSSCKEKEKQRETEDFKQILKEKDEQLRLRSKLKEQQRETEALQQRFDYEEVQHQNTRSSHKENEKEIEDLKQIIKEKDEQLDKLIRSLRDKEKETEALKRTINEKDKQLQFTKSGKQKEIEALLQRIHEMEAQLQKSRSALREKDEQLKSFKDRVAGEVALSIKTGNTMSLNNPVSKNRLKEMYEDLRCDWPRIKKNLKSNNKHPDSVKELILKEFREAKIEMRNRRMMIDKVFEKGKNAGGTPQKVDQYRQLTVQNLQMTLYNEKQDAGSQKPFLENEAGNPQDVLQYLGSECYWLGCLMALNNPPLQPDWENHPPSMDRWDFFPRNIRNASENE